MPPKTDEERPSSGPRKPNPAEIPENDYKILYGS